MKIPQIKLVMSERVNVSDRPRITRSGDAYEILKPFYTDEMEIREVCYAIIMNRKNRVLGVQLISIGTATQALMNARAIAQACLLANGTAVVLSHNHPSGDKFPSQSDNGMTNRIKQCLKMLEIDLLDHLVMTSDGYYSYADNGSL